MRTLKEQLEIVKSAMKDGPIAQQINDHVKSCQICETGQFCDRFEEIINDIERKLENDKHVH